jgi:hypothetical protein
MEDIMDLRRKVLIDNLTWFGGYTTNTGTD